MTGNLHRHSIIFLVICLFISFQSFLCKKESTGLITTSAELSVWALNVCLRASAAVNLFIIAVLAVVHHKASQWFIPTFKHNTGIRNGNLPVMSKTINIFPHNMIFTTHTGKLYYRKLWKVFKEGNWQIVGETFLRFKKTQQ